MEKTTRKEGEKQQRKAGILDAGEKIFNEHGFDGASMDAIAKEAEFTKRTVYQYFPNKEDLFFAVVARSYCKLRSYLENAASAGKTGKEKLRLCLDGYRKFYNDDPGRFFLMNQVGYVRKSAEITENFIGWTDSVQSLFKQNEQYVSEGIEDGSIKNLANVGMRGSVTTFMLTSLFNFFSQTGDHPVYDEPAILVWPRGVFHRIKRGSQGSASVNLASRYEGFDIHTKFSIFDLDTQSGNYHEIRRGELDQV